MAGMATYLGAAYCTPHIVHQPTGAQVYAAPVVAPRVIQVPAVQTVNSGYGTRIASVPVVPTSTASTGSTPVVPTSTTNTSSGGARRQFMNPKSFMLLYNFKGDFKINGRPMILTVDPPDSAKLATGLRIWDGGIVLAKYLEFYAPKMAQRLQRPLRGIELGCGTGVAGFGLAFLGHQVLLTDIGAEQAAATQGNIAQNMQTLAATGGSAQYGHLDWRQLPERSQYGRFDLVLASDVIWHESLVEPFLQAVSWATSGPGAEEVILSHKARDQESIELFHKMLGPLGLALTSQVPSEQVLGEHGHPDVQLYHLRRVQAANK